MNLFPIGKKNSDNENLLTLVGVGPGDPSLLTIAAVDAIKKATLISFPVSKEGGKSIAAEICSLLIKKKKKLPLLLPMVNQIDQLQSAWSNATKKIIQEVEKGEKVVFLCQGDPSLYATSAYILISLKLNFPKYPIRIIPGISSFSTAAAIGQIPLALQKEQLLVVPVPESQALFEKLLSEAIKLERIIVFIKLGSRWSWVKPLLKNKGLLERTLFAKNICLSDQLITEAINVSDQENSYFSLLIIRQNWPLKLPLTI